MWWKENLRRLSKLSPWTALLMAAFRASLLAEIRNHYAIRRIFEKVNRLLYESTDTGKFVTAFYGVLDVPNKRLTYCNAGHSPGMLLRDGEVTELAGSNMVLGVDCDEPYAQSIVDLKRGDTLLLYTDGLVEAINFEQQMFGRQRIIEALRQGGASSDIIAQNILWTARKFVGLSRKSDDMTMLVARLT